MLSRQAKLAPPVSPLRRGFILPPHVKTRRLRAIDDSRGTSGVVQGARARISDQGQAAAAITSLMSDLTKHPETAKLVRPRPLAGGTKLP